MLFMNEFSVFIDLMHPLPLAALLRLGPFIGGQTG